MPLKDLNLKVSYSSEKDDLLNDFYIPVLKESKIYKRITGFFSSTAFSISAEGLSEFIENGGVMEFVTNIQFAPQDYEAIEKGIKNPEEIIEEYIIEDISELEEGMKKNHVKILAWLIATGKLELKIGYIPNKITGREILHQKVGILMDESGNMLSFSGSNNETAFGWKYNSEKFKVFKGWEDSFKEYVEDDLNDFNELWNNSSKKTKVISFPEAAKNKIIELAPKSEKEFKKILKEISNFSEDEDLFNIKDEKIILWDNQRDAIKKWNNNNNKGILRIATGCGKTIIGVSILKENLKKRAINLLVSPKEEINTQWIEDFNKFLDMEKIVFTNKKEWKKMANNALSHYQNNRVDSIIFVTTYKMLPKLVSLLNSYNIYSKDNLIIADEAHSLGAEETSKIIEDQSFISNFPKRLGLSATPESIYDDKRNNKLYDFLGKIIYEYGIKGGIRDRILCKYEYYIKIVKMTKEDHKEYLKLTRNLASLYYRTKDKDKKNEIYNLLINKRARIIKESDSKFVEFDKILNDLKNKKDMGNTLIFGENHKHLDKIYEILEKNGISSAKIIENTKPKQREKIFENIKRGIIDTVTSTSILDEGINIKSLKNAIILSSSTNPRQYIQRRGRVLRTQKHNPYKVAKIYDFFVIPPFFEKENYDLDKTIIEKELKRIKEFIDCSDNFYETKWKNYELLKILKKFDLEKKFRAK